SHGTRGSSTTSSSNPRPKGPLHPRRRRRRASSTSTAARPEMRWTGPRTRSGDKKAPRPRLHDGGRRDLHSDPDDPDRSRGPVDRGDDAERKGGGAPLPGQAVRPGDRALSEAVWAVSGVLEGNAREPASNDPEALEGPDVRLRRLAASHSGAARLDPVPGRKRRSEQPAPGNVHGADADADALDHGTRRGAEERRADRRGSVESPQARSARVEGSALLRSVAIHRRRRGQRRDHGARQPEHAPGDARPTRPTAVDGSCAPSGPSLRRLDWTSTLLFSAFK